MRTQSSPVIESASLFIRQVEPGDAPAWFSYTSDRTIMQYTSGTVRQLSDVEAVLERACSNEPGTTIGFAICRQDYGAFIGYVGFHTISMHNGTAEITYDLNPEHWGRGIATLACKAAVAWAFSDQGLCRVQGTTLEENVASQRVLEKSGLLFEGRLRNFRKIRGEPRDYLLYAATPESWRREEA